MKKHDKQKNKLLAARLILIVFVLFVFLLLINSIDFTGADTSEDKSDDIQKVTVNTYGEHHFEKPEYDEDPLLDKVYTEKMLGIYYTYGSETHYFEKGSHGIDRYCDFFRDYFDALISGDEEKVTLMHTEHFLAENKDFKDLAPQKIYDVKITALEKTLIEDPEDEYYKYTVARFKVSYKIYANNGTFRRDIIEDFELPIILEVLEIGGKMKINSLGYIGIHDPVAETKSPIPALISLALGIIFVVSSVIEVITRRLYALPVAVSSLAGFFALMAEASVTLALVLFFVLLAALYTARIALSLYKKRKTKDTPPEKE